jgi:hypothetical protein
MINEGCGRDSVALEKVLRRLMGVQLADDKNNWALCDALQYNGPGNTLLSRSLLTTTLKQAAQMDSLNRRVGGGQQGYGQKPYYTNYNNNQRGSRGGGGYRGGWRGGRGGGSAAAGSTSGNAGGAPSQ